MDIEFGPKAFVWLKRHLDYETCEIMVTDWNPLTIWFYEECYIRFSASEFSLHDLKNRFVHLTNNSVNKLSDQHDAPEELFWKQQQLSDHMQE